jgi:hypothetical protein
LGAETCEAVIYAVQVQLRLIRLDEDLEQRHDHDQAA